MSCLQTIAPYLLKHILKPFEVNLQSLDHQLHVSLLENDPILLRRYFVCYQGPGRREECTNSSESAV